MKNKPIRRLPWRIVTGIALLGVLAACQSATHSDGPDHDAVATLQRINQAGATCWIRSGDPQFRDIRLMPELDTSAGQPRLLLLPKNNLSGLPLIVIEASGSPATVDVFGPLTTRPTGTRINSDVRRWAAGKTSCA